MEEKPICPFGEVLVKARKARGITQYRLAQMVDRDPRYINQLEHNKRKPKVSTVIRLARALEMDAGELVNDLDKLMPEFPAEKMDVPLPKKRGRPKKKK